MATSPNVATTAITRTVATSKKALIADARAHGYGVGVAARTISIYSDTTGAHEIARITWNRASLSFALVRDGDRFRKTLGTNHLRAALGLDHGQLERAEGGSAADSLTWPWEHRYVPADLQN